MFSDFGDAWLGCGDDYLPSAGAQSLQRRLDQLINQEQENEVRISANWKNGHWSVRGCSLDPGVEKERIIVSSLCPIDDSNTILVGRTDGSICWLELGNEYIAKFVNKLSAREGKNDTIEVIEQLEREDMLSETSSETPQTSNQFQVLCQVKASSGGISQIVVEDEYLVCATSSGSIEFWVLSGDEPMSEDSKILCNAPSPIITMFTQSMDGRRVLVCVCKDGHVLTWDIGSQFAMKESHLQIPGETILSFFTDETFCYFGTRQGHLLVYNTRDVLSGTLDIDAVKRFSPFADSSAGVSAIISSQESIFESKLQESTTLFLGSTNGKIKQYALMPMEKGLEHWPRLENQSIPGICHKFGLLSSEEPVQALRIIPGAILAVTTDQLILWDPENGQRLFEMLGLDFISTAPSLVLLDYNSVLITNGMKHLVCLHDFSERELDVDENFEAL